MEMQLIDCEGRSCPDLPFEGSTGCRESSFVAVLYELHLPFNGAVLPSQVSNRQESTQTALATDKMTRKKALCLLAPGFELAPSFCDAAVRPSGPEPAWGPWTQGHRRMPFAKVPSGRYGGLRPC